MVMGDQVSDILLFAHRAPTSVIASSPPRVKTGCGFYFHSYFQSSYPLLLSDIVPFTRTNFMEFVYSMLRVPFYWADFILKTGEFASGQICQTVYISQ
jgi:hypothetical protein